MIWLLLIVYQIKHFLADYPLQGKFMLGKFKPFPQFILPLLSHGLVHGLFTFFIALYLKPWDVAMALGIFDMTIHSVVDWVKANPSIGGRFTALSKREMVNIIYRRENFDSTRETDVLNKATDDASLKSNVFFWWALGADQMAHHLTHYAIIWALMP